MAHYAIIDDENKVLFVFPGRNENESIDGVNDWELYYGQIEGKKCLRVSYNTRAGVHYNPETGEPSEDQSKAFRANYAGIGFTYDEELDAFIPPKPFDSWVLDEATCLWEAPVEYPQDGEDYLWNEETISWDLVVSES